jgi:hypothetical protein
MRKSSNVSDIAPGLARMAGGRICLPVLDLGKAVGLDIPSVLHNV